MMTKASVPQCIFGNKFYYLKRDTSSSGFFYKITGNSLNLILNLINNTEILSDTIKAFESRQSGQGS